MRLLASAALCCAMLFAASARAETGFAVFNVQKVVTECDALQEAKTAMEKKFGGQKDALEKQRSELEKKITASKGKTNQADLAKMQREFSEKAQAFMRVLQAEEARLRKEIDAVITSAAKELARKKGYSAILDSAAAVYCDPANDVTDAMLAETNALWKQSKENPAPAKDAKDPAKAPRSDQ
jgi:outer membrane protein